MKVWRPYTQMQNAPPREFARAASGAYIELKDGRKVFDGISSWWLITHGHCHPEISEAIARQSERVDQLVFANFSHEPAEELVETLGTLLPRELCSAFFSDNGSTAVEVALKMAYQYTRLKGETSKSKFCAFEHSFHGDTFGSMSVTADGTFTQAYDALRLDVIRVSQGERSSDPLEKWTADFRKTIEERHAEMIAVILEPKIQGAGGMLMWPTEAVRTVAELCREYGVLLIFDEVMTGFGRTGKLFAFEHLGVVPDFVCLSKGLTGGALSLALTLTTAEIYESFLSEDSKKMFFHGHSFTANAISCAAAVANLKLFKETQALERVRKIEEAHRSALDRLSSTLDLRDIRVCGAIGALELKSSGAYAGEASRRMQSECLKRGLFLRPLGNILYLFPPYCAEPSEIAWAWDVIAAATTAQD